MTRKVYQQHEQLFAERTRDPEYWREFWRHEPFYSVARDLRGCRRDQKISQIELARKAKTHQSRISKLESAESDFRLSTLIEVADALGAHVDIRIVPNLDWSPQGYGGLIVGPYTVVSQADAKKYTDIPTKGFVTIAQ